MASFWIYARGSWRRLDEASGRVAGWAERPRFCFFRRGRLELANSSTVLRGLRALLEKQPTTVKNGLPLTRRRKKPPKPSRCCCSHKCQHTDSRSALVQLNLSTQCANSTQTSVTALQPVKTDAAVQASVGSAQTDKTPVLTDTGVCRGAGEDSESSSPACKELVVNEEDVAVLRSFLEHDDLFDVDLYRFDTDDDYKSAVFYKINPLVCVERCARISAMLSQRSPQCSLREFARVLGLRSVAAHKHRLTARRTRSGKENHCARRNARVFPNKSANKSSNEWSNTSNNDTTNQSDSDFELKTKPRKKRSLETYNANSIRKPNDNNKAKTSKLKSKNDSVYDFESDEEDIKKYKENTRINLKDTESNSKDVDAERRNNRPRSKKGTFAKNVVKNRVRTKNGTFARDNDGIDNRESDYEVSDDSISIISKRITRGQKSDVIQDKTWKEDKEGQRDDDDSKETDRRNKRKYIDSSDDSDDEVRQEKGKNEKTKARTVTSVVKNLLKDTDRRQSLRSQNSSPVKSQSTALQRSDHHRHTDNYENIRHLSVDTEKSSEVFKQKENSQSNDNRSKDLRKRTIDKKISEKSTESINRRLKRKFKENRERERDGSEERERSYRLRHDRSLETDSRKSRIDKMALRTNDLNAKNTKKRSVSTSSESDNRLKHISKKVVQNGDISKSNDLNDKNTKRRSRVRIDSTSLESDSLSARTNKALDQNYNNPKGNDSNDENNDFNDKNTKRRSGRLILDSISQKSESLSARIKKTLDRNDNNPSGKDFNDKNDEFNDKNDEFNDKNDEFNDKNDFNDKNTKRRSGRLRLNSTSQESDSRSTRTNKTLDRNDNSKNNDFNKKNKNFNEKHNDFNEKNKNFNERNKDFNEKNKNFIEKHNDFNEKNNDFNEKNKNFNEIHNDFNEKNKIFNEKNNDFNEKNSERTNDLLKKSKNNLKDGKKVVDVVKNVSVGSKDLGNDGDQSKERNRRSTCNYENTSGSLRREYSTLEDQAIVQWLTQGSRARRVNGNMIWRELQSEFNRIAGSQRSWHSLRNRYLRSILPALGELSLPPSKIAALRAGQAHGEIKSKRRPPLPNPLLVHPPVKSAFGAKHKKPRADTTDDDDAQDTVQPTRRSRSHKRPDTPTPRNGRRASQDGGHTSQDGGDSRSPTYSELTRRFASRRGVSTPETQRQGSASPPAKRTRKLFNPNKNI